VVQGVQRLREEQAIYLSGLGFFEMQTKRGTVGLRLSEFRFIFGVVDEFVS